MNKLINLSYAVSVAMSQGLATFAQIRADQLEMAKMTDKQMKQFFRSPEKVPIGFTRIEERCED